MDSITSTIIEMLLLLPAVGFKLWVDHGSKEGETTLLHAAPAPHNRIHPSMHVLDILVNGNTLFSHMEGREVFSF